MEVLLLRDVKSLGEAGEIKTVANGYGRNYLLPRGLAVLATKGARKQAEQIREAARLRREQERSEAQAQADRIAGLELTFKAKAGEKGKLYGSVTTANIADAIAEAIGSEIDKRRVQLEHPLRELGTYQVGIKLLGDIVPEVTVRVEAEGVEVATEETSDEETTAEKAAE